MIKSVLIILLILVVMPFLAGLVPSFFLERNKVRLSEIYIFGFIFLMAVFQLIAVPVIVLKPQDFSLVQVLFGIIQAVIAALGIVLTAAKIKKYGSPIKNRDTNGKVITKDEIVLWIIAIILVVFQVVMYVITQSFDGDDAYYVVQSLLTQETGTMYSIKPYTGLTTGIDLRHALAAVPMWIAYIGCVSGIHSTVVAHTIIGVFIIPLLYMIYYQIGILLFGKDRKRIPIMLILISTMYIFGNVSIYTNATFMLTRTWQGKSMLANMVILTVTWLLLAMYETEGFEKEFRLGYWIMMIATNIVAAMCSTASVFLMAILIGLSGLVMAIAKRDIQVVLRLLVTCLPLVLYGAMYILI